jgi:hypothetical protein
MDANQPAAALEGSGGSPHTQDLNLKLVFVPADRLYSATKNYANTKKNRNSDSTIAARKQGCPIQLLVFRSPRFQYNIQRAAVSILPPDEVKAFQ